MSRYFFDDLYMADRVVFVDYEDRTAQQAEFLDQNSVGLSKGGFPVIRAGLDLVDARRAAKAVLGEWQIHTNREDFKVARQLGRSAASSLKRRVCWSQTGVSKEGTTLISRAFPRELSNVTGERSLAITTKLGALSPTLISGPISVSEFPLKVMTPLLSWDMIVPPMFGRFVHCGSEKRCRAIAERLELFFNIPPWNSAVKET